MDLVRADESFGDLNDLPAGECPSGVNKPTGGDAHDNKGKQNMKKGIMLAIVAVAAIAAPAFAVAFHSHQHEQGVKNVVCYICGGKHGICIGAVQHSYLYRYDQRKRSDRGDGCRCTGRTDRRKVCVL